MSRKPAPKTTALPPANAPTDVSGIFYAVGKDSHLLYTAWEVEVKDGVVVRVKGLSRAPDLAATAVGKCASEIWSNLRTQKAPNAG